MGKYTDLLRAAGGVATTLDRLGAWRMSVSRLLDVEAVVVFYPWIRFGAVVPTVAEAGPTVGWLMTVGDVWYTEFPLNLFDRSQPIVYGVAWAPAGSESGKTVSWHLDIGAEDTGSVVTTIDATADAVDIAVPEVAATYARTGISLAPSIWANPDIDELHVKGSRVASTSDPALPPGIHHIAIVGVAP